MRDDAEPIVIPLGRDRRLLVTPTDDPDCVTVRLHGRNTGHLMVLPHADNSVSLMPKPTTK